MRFLSSCLSGEIREEKFYFWTGSGGNGKSKLVELIDFVLGDYSRSMDVALLLSVVVVHPHLQNLKISKMPASFICLSLKKQTLSMLVSLSR